VTAAFIIDNSTDILDEGTNSVGRIGNSTQIELRATGRLRMISNSGAAVNEDLGALLQATGSGKVNFRSRRHHSAAHHSDL
jgi:hypothetical protein